VTRAQTVGVVGAGRFGTTLANLVAGTGRDVVLWTTSPAVAAEINEQRTNETRMPGLELAPSLYATNEPAELAERARFIVVAVASTDVCGRVHTLGGHLDGGHLVVHANGAFAAGDDRRVSQVLRDETPTRRIGTIAGPAPYNDLAHGKFSSMVVASEFDEVTAEGQRLLGVPPVLRLYRGNDLLGVELAAALSGAHTIALAIADALDIGTGPRAVMVTRAVAEASRLGKAMGANPRTFAGLAGLGNLLVRSTPEARARDYLIGLELAAHGRVPKGQETEGLRAAATAIRLADKFGVQVPILRAVDTVARGELDASEAAQMVAATVTAEE